MSSNRNNLFFKLDIDSLSEFIGKNIVLQIASVDDVEYENFDTVIGTLQCIDYNRIYLSESFGIDVNDEYPLYDEFQKLDPSLEDPKTNHLPHIKISDVQAIFVTHDFFELEHTCSIWIDPRDYYRTLGENLKPNYLQRIESELNKNSQCFNTSSQPFFVDEFGLKITLKQIHSREATRKPVTLIAVTRHQFNCSRFMEFTEYVKNTLKKERVYYGLWSNGKTTEYDVLYCVSNKDELIQKHLNMHDSLNGGSKQVMGLKIFEDGTYLPVRNNSL
jgi:hypothetical protein